MKSKSVGLIFLISSLVMLGVLMVPAQADADHWPLWKYKTSDSVVSVDLSVDGRNITAGNSAGEVLFFHKSSSTPLWQNTTHSDVNSVAISADGQYLVTGGDNLVQLYDTASPSPTWDYPSSLVSMAVDISAGGDDLVATYRNHLHYFVRGISSPQWTYSEGVGATFVAAAISASGQYIVAGNFNDNVFLFNKTNPMPPWIYPATDPWKVAITADGDYFVAGGDDYAHVFSLDGPKLLWNFTSGSFIYSIALSSNGERVAVGSNSLYVFNRSDPMPLWNFSLDLSDSTAYCLSLSADGQYLAVGTGWRVYLFCTNNSSPLWSYSTENRVDSLAISADGQYIVAGLRDGHVCLFHQTVVGPPETSDIPGFAAVVVGFALAGIAVIHRLKRRGDHIVQGV